MKSTEFCVEKNKEEQKRPKKIVDLFNNFTSHHLLYYWGNKIKDVKCAGHVARMQHNEKLCKFLVGRPEGKTPERFTRKWEG
jgi:hypothetical protein